MTEQIQCPQCKAEASLIGDSLICLACNYKLEVPNYTKEEMQIRLAYLEAQLKVLDIKSPSALSRTLQQLKAQVRYIRNKLNEHLTNTKKEEYVVK